MVPILDPRDGDIEDDASSTKRRSLLRLAGNMLAEISLPKLAVVWLLLIGIPGLLLGGTPLLASVWMTTVLSKAFAAFAGIWSLLALILLVALGWIGGRQMLQLVESSFWSLSALAVQPAYVLCREGFRHIVEALLAGRMGPPGRARARAGSAAASGLTICCLAVGVIAVAWPATRWLGSMADLAAPALLLHAVLANAVVLISAYLAAAALVWGMADATMAQPADHPGFAIAKPGLRAWRIAHLSDLHTVGERYGFRIESGRSGPRGNARLDLVLARLNEVHATEPLDVVLITGDLTDAGRSAEWAEFMSALTAYPRLAERVVALPGNHDVNVVDRASPARMEWPASPTKRLRRLRMLSALEVLQGTRLRVVDRGSGRLGDTLTEVLGPHAAAMAAFADTGSPRLWQSLSNLWLTVFPLVMAPEAEDGLGVIVLELECGDAFLVHQRSRTGHSRSDARIARHCPTLPARLLDRRAPSPRHRISPTGVGVLRARRHRADQRDLVRSWLAPTHRSSRDHARSPPHRLDRALRGAADHIRAVACDGAPRRARPVLLRSYACTVRHRTDRVAATAARGPQPHRGDRLTVAPGRTGGRSLGPRGPHSAHFGTKRRPLGRTTLSFSPRDPHHPLSERQGGRITRRVGRPQADIAKGAKKTWVAGTSRHRIASRRGDPACRLPD